MENSKKKHRKILKRVLLAFLAIILVLVILVGIYCYQNWSIIRILFLDTEKTKENVVATSREFESKIENYMEIEIEDFTEEEEEKIANGELSAATILVERIENYAKNHPEVKENLENEIIISYTEKFSALQTKYIGVLEGLLASAKEEYFSGEYNAAQKTVLLNTYMKKARAAEAECNSEFEALISELEAELKAVGADLSIIDTIRKTYEDEKAAKEVYYRNKYINKV